MALKLIGYWYDRHGDQRWPHPRRLAGFRWESGLESRVIDYLRRGRVCAEYRGWSECRFGCGRNGSRELTDGVFAWPEGLSHYVEIHRVRLPEEFIDHARSLGFRPPDEPRSPTSGPPDYDLSFWADWCRRVAPEAWWRRAFAGFRRPFLMVAVFVAVIGITMAIAGLSGGPKG